MDSNVPKCKRMVRTEEKLSEAPRPQGGASRARSGEQNASQRNLIYTVPPVVGSNRLDPAYKAGLTGHLPIKDFLNHDQRIVSIKLSTNGALSCSDKQYLISVNFFLNWETSLPTGWSFKITWLTYSASWTKSFSFIPNRVIS